MMVTYSLNSAHNLAQFVVTNSFLSEEINSEFTILFFNSCHASNMRSLTHDRRMKWIGKYYVDF